MVYQYNKVLSVRESIKILSDYIMLVSVSNDFSNFYYGRSGISISLFEASKYLNDEYTEEYAFRLLQQSLLYDKTDISFDKGLSGIGFSLLYLINNKFIDAKIDDLFSGQIKIIKETINRLSLEDISIENIDDYLHIAFFLRNLYMSSLCSLIKDDSIYDTIYGLLYEKFDILFNYVYEMNKNLPLEFVLHSWTKLLVHSVVSKYRPSQNILEKYLNLCLLNRVKFDSVAFTCLKYWLNNTKSLLFVQYENRIKRIYYSKDIVDICIDKDRHPNVSLCINQYIRKKIHDLNINVEELVNQSNSISEIEKILNYYNANNRSLLGMNNGLPKLLTYMLYVINDKNSNVRLSQIILLT